jgi:hypothetical protein
VYGDLDAGDLFFHMHLYCGIWDFLRLLALSFTRPTISTIRYTHAWQMNLRFLT